MRSWMIVIAFVTMMPVAASAQPAGSGSGSGSGSAGSGSAAGSAEATPAPAPPAPPEPNKAQLHGACVSALNDADKAGNKLFLGDVGAVAAGLQAQSELAKTPGGQACLSAFTIDPGFRAAMGDQAKAAAAEELVARTKQQHEDAAHSIAKNERHVILAYAAMWLLAAGFVLFLWRRQQGLQAEISRLRRDLEAAAK